MATWRINHWKSIQVYDNVIIHVGRWCLTTHGMSMCPPWLPISLLYVIPLSCPVISPLQSKSYWTMGSSVGPTLRCKFQSKKTFCVMGGVTHLSIYRSYLSLPLTPNFGVFDFPRFYLNTFTLLDLISNYQRSAHLTTHTTPFVLHKNSYEMI